MMTYEEAKKLLGNRETKKLVHRTVLYKDDQENYCIQYWNTVVVRITPKNHYIISHGGYNTPTTKRRIENYSSARIRQRNWSWEIFDRKRDSWIDYSYLLVELDADGFLL